MSSNDEEQIRSRICSLKSRFKKLQKHINRTLEAADETSNVVSSTTDSSNWNSFSGRVYSFCQPKMALAWLLKPDELSPLQCAKYGWKLLKNDLIQCETCKKIICCKLPDPSRGLKQYKSSVNEKVKALESSHLEFCPWSVNPCPDSFLTLCNDPLGVLKNNLSTRLKSLQIMECSLEINDSFMSEDAKELCKSILKLIPEKYTWMAFLFAITGWKYCELTESRLKYLECDRCFRKILVKDGALLEELTLQQTDPCFEEGVSCSKQIKTPSGDEGVTDESLGRRKKRMSASEEANSKKQKTSTQNFDPVHEHKTWCPWVASCSIQNKNQTKSGWLAVVHILSPKEDGSPSLISSSKYNNRWSGLTTVRNMIQGWKADA